MLNVLRQKGFSKVVLWIITTIIIVSFVIFGSAYRLDYQINGAGKANGREISGRVFQQAYLDARDQAIIIYGDEFFRNGGQIDLEQQAWDRIILLDEIKKRKITVSDQDVVNFIAQIPYFNDNGQFSQFKYRLIVRDRNIFGRQDTRQFEEGVRHNLEIKKLFETISASAPISEADLLKQYTLRHEKLTLDYAIIDPTPFKKDITLKDEDIADFYAKNKEAFRQQPTIKLDYVHLIVAEKATEAEKQAAKTTIFNLSAALTANSDFNALAKKFGLEVKESDYFSLEQPLLTFASSPQDTEKMFAMKVGEISKPLSVPDGWQIVRVHDKKDTHIPALDEIKDAVKDALLTNKAFEMAKVKAEEILPKLIDLSKTSDFNKAAKSLGLESTQTPAFSRGEYIANVGIVSELQSVTQSLNAQNPISSVILTSQGPAIVHLAKTEPIDPKQFETEKEEFKQMVEAQQRQQKIGIFMNELRLKANIKSRLKKNNS